MKMFFRISIVVFLLITVVTVPQAVGQFFVFSHPLIGKEAPDFTLDTLSKNNVTFSAYRQEKPAILFFWTTWCPHCRTQIKELSQQIPLLKEQGIEIIIVDLQESAQQIKRYLEKNNLQLDVFLDSDANVAEEYKVQGVPTFVFVDKSGLVKAVEHQLPDDYKDLIM